jgi:hypothetical protein
LGGVLEVEKHKLFGNKRQFKRLFDDYFNFTSVFISELGKNFAVFSIDILLNISFNSFKD